MKNDKKLGLPHGNVTLIAGAQNPKYNLKETAEKLAEELGHNKTNPILHINANIPTKELEKLREKYSKNSVDEIFEIK